MEIVRLNNSKTYMVIERNTFRSLAHILHPAACTCKFGFPARRAFYESNTVAYVVHRNRSECARVHWRGVNNVFRRRVRRSPLAGARTRHETDIACRHPKTKRKRRVHTRAPRRRQLCCLRTNARSSAGPARRAHVLFLISAPFRRLLSAADDRRAAARLSSVDQPNDFRRTRVTRSRPCCSFDALTAACRKRRRAGGHRNDSAVQTVLSSSLAADRSISIRQSSSSSIHFRFGRTVFDTTRGREPRSRFKNRAETVAG